MVIQPTANGNHLVVDEETGEILSEHETKGQAEAAIFTIEVWGRDNCVTISEFYH